jgi:FtsP/CotA-like multicopper oxidase with cupredoxin domain
MRRPDRREVLAAAAAILASRPAFALETGSLGNGRLRETRGSINAVSLRANEHLLALTKRPTPAWIYGDEAFPVLRVARGKAVTALLENSLKEHTSIHWHGLRIPNAMDGVPYVTQKPVQPGERFTYRFTPPDAGTFFFHPHCNTSEQLGRGLAGVLVVEGDEAERFDDDVVCVIKDWRIDANGNFLPFITPTGAARAGTFGTLRTVNARVSPKIDLPAGADVRLRLVNADSTRIAEVGIEGAPATVIAIDGHALKPFTLETWRLGPAMRLDLALHIPADGKTLRLVDYFAAEPVTLATLAAHGPAKRRQARRIKLAPARLPEPNLSRSEFHMLMLGTMAGTADYASAPDIVLPNGARIALADSLCLSQRNFWTIDGQSWPAQGHQHLPPPLMNFRRGQSVAIEFFNATPHPHPMHLHGHAFKVLSADRFKRPVHWADTVLVMPDERVRIAFVADNPGNWMIHCHIIEHQDTGMMAWFRVS